MRNPFKTDIRGSFPDPSINSILPQNKERWFELSTTKVGFWHIVALVKIPRFGYAFGVGMNLKMLMKPMSDP